MFYFKSVDRIGAGAELMLVHFCFSLALSLCPFLNSQMAIMEELNVTIIKSNKLYWK